MLTYINKDNSTPPKINTFHPKYKLLSPFLP